MRRNLENDFRDVDDVFNNQDFGRLDDDYEDWADDLANIEDIEDYGKSGEYEQDLIEDEVELKEMLRDMRDRA